MPLVTLGVALDKLHFIFWLSLLSRRNKVGLKCLIVCPQKVSSILMKFGVKVEVDK